MPKILVVDDSVSLRKMIAFTLTEAGHVVSEAGDGVEALSAAKKTNFEIVISDVNMPNMDGITFIKELRTIGQYKFTPILMLTTESGADKKAEGKQAGATGWLVKPFNPETLLATISKVTN